MSRPKQETARKMAPSPFYCLLTLGIVVFALQVGSIGAQEGAPAAAEEGKAPGANPEGKADEGKAGESSDANAPASASASKPTTAEAAKHVVALRLKTDPTKPICAGSLIKANVVLTAAQCLAFDDAEKLATVTMGSVNLGGDALKSDISKIVSHSGFKDATGENDIALVFLKNPVTDKDKKFAAPIELNKDEVKAAEKCTVTGWAIAASATEVLQSEEVPIVDCKKPPPTNMMCGGSTVLTDSNTCTGDSGGPLVCKNKLSGIVSYGSECNVKGVPGVYIDVRKYAEWIDKEVTKATGSSIKPAKKNGSNYLRPTMSTVLLAIGLCVWQAIQKCNTSFI